MTASVVQNITLTPNQGLDYMVQDAIMLLPNATGTTLGDCWVVDTAVVDSSFRYTTLAAPATADFTFATNAFTKKPACVALETVAAPASGQAKVRVRFRGVVSAKINSTSVIVGDFLTLTNGQAYLTEMTATGSAGGFYLCAQALEANTVAGAVKKVLFDGLTGHGIQIT